MEESYIDCPLCTQRAHHETVGKDEQTGLTHMWVCESCPFVGFEFWSDWNAYHVYNRLIEIKQKK